MSSTRPSRFPSTPGLVHVATIAYKASEDGPFDEDGLPDTGTVTLPGALPAGAIVIGGSVQGVTLVEGGTLKMSLGALDLFTAAAVDPDDGIAPVDIDDTVLDEPKLLAEDTRLVATIATGGLTAGEVHVHLRYIMSQSFDYSQSDAIVPEITA